MVEMVDTLINGRWTLKLPEHRAARPEWDIANGGWELERLEHMHSTVKPDDRVLYIGGEEGDLAAVVASWGAHLRIVEPNELVWPNIKAIWEANQLPPLWSMFVGFCGKETSDNYMDGWFDDWPPCADGPIIGDHGFKELRDPGGRPVIKVDDLAVKPDMITMDVEGAEWEVLQGAEWTIDKFHPRIYLSLHPEFLIDQYGTYSRDVRNWIIDKGYTETLLAWDHEAHMVYEPA